MNEQLIQVHRLEPWRAHVGEFVRSAREQQGLTIQELADKSFVHHSMIDRLESGRRDVRLSTVARVARGLGVSIPVNP